MKKLNYIIVTVLVLSLLFYFFVGNEIIGREEGYEYNFFIKNTQQVYLFFGIGFYVGNVILRNIQN
ncbi:hypothetical protein SAMN05421733_10651 [Acinetobacter boissieri]|uniref:Uncharacterized protein n=1 Tax=Acinetobacter boissieri TaxID=1219383 RepID=A0A1G6HJ57_9GAMM|nr:hypothetical protein SAMN05421733_10651 [Acinetobacter boissieri]